MMSDFTSLLRSDIESSSEERIIKEKRQRIDLCKLKKKKKAATKKIGVIITLMHFHVWGEMKSGEERGTNISKP